MWWLGLQWGLGCGVGGVEGGKEGWGGAVKGQAG